MIKHIVIESGGYKGLYVLGALDELNKSKYYNIENIETIYGTSIGSYVGVLLCLKMKWEDLLEYFINRPWHKAQKFPLITTMFSDKGLLDSSLFYVSLKNLFFSKDLTLDLTFQELYDYSNIELHMFTVEIQEFKLIDLSYKTHPNMKIIEGIYKSCAIPYVFKPCWADNNYYIDGGVMNDYPVEDCISNGALEDEILGFKFKRPEKKIITKDCNIIDFSRHLHSRLIDICRKYRNSNKVKLKNEIIIEGNRTEIDECVKLLKDSKMRNEYINHGRKTAREFLELLS